MLSAKSEAFIDNLRLYLMASGKKDQEVKEITEELSDHLAEAEKHGKTVEEITDGSPEAYMKSIKEEMKTDYLGLLKSSPIFFLTVLAYFIAGPAIRGEFSINMIQLIGFPVVLCIGLAAYIVFLQKAGKKQYPSRKLFLFAMGAQIVLTVLFLLVLLVGDLLAKPIYEAGTIANAVVLLLCSVIFVSMAVWSKTWFSIIIPLILFGPTFLLEQMNTSVEVALYSSAAVSIMACLLITIWPLFMKRKDQPKL